MLGIAFKEWAGVCGALAAGRQAVILRKGGVAEDGGAFRPEHARFWLYPTYVHQQAAGLTEDAAGLLADAEAARPPAGTARLAHVAEVDGVYDVRSEAAALSLAGLHVWSEATVRQRFAYRTPGLYVLVVRVARAAAAHDVVETPEYAGCKSWVRLDQPLPAGDATPVLDDAAFAAVRRELDRRLRPTATV